MNNNWKTAADKLLAKLTDDIKRMDDTADYMEIQSRRNNVRACVHITRPGTETTDHWRESKDTKCPGWIKLAVILQVCTDTADHWRGSKTLSALGGSSYTASMYEHATSHMTRDGTINDVCNHSRRKAFLGENIERDCSKRVIRMSLMMNLTLTNMKIGDISCCS